MKYIAIAYGESALYPEEHLVTRQTESMKEAIDQGEIMFMKAFGYKSDWSETGLPFWSEPFGMLSFAHPTEPDRVFVVPVQ